MSRSLRLLVCHHYLKEVRDVLQACGYDEVRVSCYPARCLQPSPALSEGERAALEAFRNRSRDEDLMLLGFCCIGQAAGVLDALRPTRVHALDSCFSLFINSKKVRRLQAEGAYILTPGWLDEWRGRIEDWGFDRQTAREFFRESVARFVLLDTGVSENSRSEFEEFVDFLGRPGETIDVGLEILEHHVRGVVLEWRLDCLRRESREAGGRTDARLAEQAMALDLLAELTRTMGEEEAADKVMDIFSMLTGAGRVDLVLGSEDTVALLRSTQREPVSPSDAAECLASIRPGEAYSIHPDGFSIRIRFRDLDLGVLAVRQLPLPDRCSDYVNLALSVINLCALAISNARTETARRRAEQELLSKAQELERSNADLSQFAYVVSHDLREPLRTVSGFLSILLRKHGAQLDEGAVGYVQQAVAGTQRMERFIRDLLQYSRAGSRAVTLVPVALGEVLASVLQSLQAAIQDSGAVVDVPNDMPLVLGHAGLLEQLFLNLISNAIKFRQDALPEIRITVLPCNGDWEISIADNGVGFDMSDSERIFRLFQRLHTTREYEGTGIGLAVCRRIVERHGGRIWAESEKGKGSTFRFTLMSGSALKRS